MSGIASNIALKFWIAETGLYETQFLAFTTPPEPKPCGLCGEPDPDTQLDNTFVKLAHGKCIEIVDKAASNLVKTINDKFINELSNRGRIAVCEYAFKTVKAHCGEDSLVAYAKKHGEEKLTELFDTVGVNSVYWYVRNQELLRAWPKL